MIDTFKSGSNPSPYEKAVEQYDNYTRLDSPDLAKAKFVRNDLVYNIMAGIDRVYGEYAVRLNAGKGAEALSFDSLTLGLTTASTIATHTPTKTILSAIGTGVTGVGQSFDKNFFAQQTFAVIAIAMQTRRDKVRNTIVNNLAQQDVTAYPLAAAKRDLVDYYYSGTLAGGLQELQEEAGNATRQQVTSIVATPVFSPAGGAYKSAKVSILDATPSVTIYYTTDGSQPSTSSSTYSEPISVMATQTIKAMAMAPGLTNSATASATYEIGDTNPEAPAPTDSSANRKLIPAQTPH
jgi:hypothetical protein